VWDTAFGVGAPVERVTQSLAAVDAPMVAVMQQDGSYTAIFWDGGPHAQVLPQAQATKPALHFTWSGPV
jgi:hypothetical protein